MVHAPWTYELPATGAAAENLDDYEARAADGAHVGIVTGLVERDGERYLLVDAGRLPPLVHRRLAFRWDDVVLVDHDALVVELACDRSHLEASALALDPALAKHDARAEAVRIHRLPAELAHSGMPGQEGPVEGGSALLVLVAAALSPWSLLAIVALWGTRGLGGWDLAAFAVPVLFAVAAVAAAGYSLYREPHLGHHAHTRA